ETRGAREPLDRGAVEMRIVELAQHVPRLDAAVHVPAALRRREIGEELLAPAANVLDDRVHFGGREHTGHGGMAFTLEFFLVHASHRDRFFLTKASSFISGYAAHTRSISSFWPGESPSFGSRHQMPSSRPWRRSTSWQPAMQPAKLFSTSKN